VVHGVSPGSDSPVLRLHLEVDRLLPHARAEPAVPRRRRRRRRAWWQEGRPKLEPNTALVLDLAGPIVEQRTGAPGRFTALQALADRERETQLRDVLAALDAAATDPGSAAS